MISPAYTTRSCWNSLESNSFIIDSIQDQIPCLAQVA